jgi:hypothetical protein
VQWRLYASDLPDMCVTFRQCDTVTGTIASVMLVCTWCSAMTCPCADETITAACVVDNEFWLQFATAGSGC